LSWGLWSGARRTRSGAPGGARTAAEPIYRLDIHREAGGAEDGFHGVYHDVAAPERVVQTFEYTWQSVFQSIEDRDAMVQSGMESGTRETMDRFAEIIAKG
jgi:hypothetical protein